MRALLPLLLLAAGALAQPPVSLLRNGGFERARGWTLGTGRLVPGRDGRCLRFEGPGGAAQEVLSPGAAPLTVAVDVRTVGVKPTAAAGYAFAAVYQLDEHGEMVEYRDFVQLQGDHDWERRTFTFTPHPNARVLSVRCGMFQAEGAAEFDNWTLVAGDQPRRLDEVAGDSARGGPGRAGLLEAPGLGEGPAPNLDSLERILRSAGLEVERLSPEALADPQRLRPDRYDLVVLPYGEGFPAAARAAWIDYLHRGGGFISLGGYAFNRPVVRQGGRWVPEAEHLARALDEAMSPERSLLADGSFETTGDVPTGGQALDARWRRNTPAAEIVAEGARQGRRCLRVSAPANVLDDERKFWLDLPAERKAYRLTGWVKTENVAGPGFAYLALYQYAEDGRLIKFTDFVHATGTTGWQEGRIDFTPEPGVTRLHVKLGLYRAHGTAWFDDLQLGVTSGLFAPPLNTANGKPADGLEVQPTQIGAFDASVPLKRAVAARTAPDQAVADAEVALEGPLEGWVATGVTGYDNARWIPLLAAYDRYGRPRGAAGAMLVNHGGFYGGSRWAYFGVANRDLFADPGSPAAKLLAQTAQALVRGAFLTHLTPGQRLYRDGEAVQISVRGELGRLADATVRVAIVPAGGAPVYEVTRPVEGDDVFEVTVPWQPGRFAADLYEVRATLLAGGRAIDTMASGFVVDRPEVMHRLPALTFAGNHFRLGDRTLFLFGTDTYSYTYRSAAENPLTWSAEHRAARDIGLDLYENLQYNNPGHVMGEADWRAFRAMAQLTQRHGLVFMPGTLIGHNVVADNAELARQAAVCAGYAEHLGDVPALLWYLNGDYQLRPDQAPEAAQALWTQFLLERYGSPAGVEKAWGDGRVKLDGEQIVFPPQANGRWDDPAQIDRLEFCHHLMRRWNAANVGGIRRHERERPITSEYYQRPFGGMDLRLTIDPQDVSNIGFFDQTQRDLDSLPVRLRWNDLRARGQGFSLGEYGVKTHPAWAESNGGRGYHIQRSEEEQEQLFLTVAALTLGMGGAKVQNWCLRDAQTNVFPWGLFYPNQFIPKDVAYVHRNESLLWRTLAPRDEIGPLALCLPSRLRTGAAEHLGLEVGERAIDGLLSLHADFHVVDDTRLDALPAATRAMVLPSPFALADADFDRLLAWVRGGGRLLVTGDVSYDARRQPTRADRLTALCGVTLTRRLAPAPDRGPAVRADLGDWGGPVELRPSLALEPAGAEVLAKAADGSPVLLTRTVGQGRVWFLPDALETAGAEADALRRGVYAGFLHAAAVPRLPVTPDEPWLLAFQRPTASGTLHTLYSRKHDGNFATATVPTAGGPLELGLRHRWPALAHVGTDGAARLVVSFGGATLGGRPVWLGEGLQGLASLDGADLGTSRRVLLAPFGPGRITLPPRPGRFTALVGDFEQGVWRTFERLPLAGDALTVPFDADRRTCLVLLSAEGEEDAAIGALTMLMERPWEMAGN